MRQVRRVHKDLPTCMAAVMVEMYGRHTSAASAYYVSSGIIVAERFYCNSRMNKSLYFTRLIFALEF